MKNYLVPVLGIIVLIILVGALYAASQRRDKDTSMETATSTPEAEASVTAARPSFVWEFENAGETEDGSPRTHVFLVANGERKDLGISEGSCAVLSGDQLEENEITATLCWFAGAGDEYGVFLEGGALTVRKGIQQEAAGEGEEFRGQFTTLISL